MKKTLIFISVVLLIAISCKRTSVPTNVGPANDLLMEDTIQFSSEEEYTESATNEIDVSNVQEASDGNIDNIIMGLKNFAQKLNSLCPADFGNNLTCSECEYEEVTNSLRFLVRCENADYIDKMECEAHRSYILCLILRNDNLVGAIKLVKATVFISFINRNDEYLETVAITSSEF